MGFFVQKLGKFHKITWGEGGTRFQEGELVSKRGNSFPRGGTEIGGKEIEGRGRDEK